MLTRLWARWGWVAVPVSIFAASRVVSTVWILRALPEQQAAANDPTLGYFDAITNWDAGWYASIATRGYPATLPTADGSVAQNEWAFLPAYPMLVRFAMWLTGLGFPVAATLVSLTCSTLALALLYHLVRDAGGWRPAVVVVLAVCVYPASPVLQLPYAESLELLLVVSALLLVRRRHYAGLIPIALALALTRQVTLALALVVGVHAMTRWRSRSRDPFPRAEVTVLGLAGLVAFASAGLWPAVAGIVTGRPNAYLDTYGAWGAMGIGAKWATSIGTDITGAGSLAALFLVYLLITTLGPRSQHLGPELRVWTLSYGLYLLAMTGFGPSHIRYLMFAFAALPPIPWGPSTLDSPAFRRAAWVLVAITAVLSVLCQYWWVANFLIVGSDPQPWP